MLRLFTLCMYNSMLRLFSLSCCQLCNVFSSLSRGCILLSRYLNNFLLLNSVENVVSSPICACITFSFEFNASAVFLCVEYACASPTCACTPFEFNASAIYLLLACITKGLILNLMLRLFFLLSASQRMLSRGCIPLSRYFTLLL